MPNSLLTPHLLDRLREFAHSAPPGDFAEFGVFQGGSAIELYRIAEDQGRRLYLFDTFRGTPFACPWDGNPVGSFADCSEKEVQDLMPRAIVISGVFPKTIDRGWILSPFGFVHCDCDQYWSVKAVCEKVPQYMTPGGIILFDDYGCQGCDGATAAVQECFPFLYEELSPYGALVRIENG